LAFLAAATPRYEADRLRICVYDRERGGVTNLTEHFDRSAAEYLWRNDSEILFLAEDRGYASLYGVGVGTQPGAEAEASTANSGAEGASVTQYTSGVTQTQLRLVTEDTVLVARESTERPPELTRLELSAGRTPSLEKGPGYPAAFDQDARTLTGFGAHIAQEVETQAPESFWFRGADDDWVHGFLLRPPQFDPSQCYPLLVIIHGGPQGAFLDEFHYRWNAQALAAPGYVVLLMNPRGSTGYGQRFTEQISEDWTGRCVTDIHAGIDHVLEHYSFVDGSRIGAAGASFGGFMVNWLAGHSDRFRVFVSHDGEFNIETMGYTTDELWFDRWEHGGAPYENPEHVRAISPHRAADQLNTPTLVIHGAKDYRCPESEGIALHTALQLRGVPSRFLYFPDEGHFVTKPANAEVWYATVLDFVGRYL
jgi:dipeptidyl aminopeptidase/acylaminoacyl peptidase